MIWQQYCAFVTTDSFPYQQPFVKWMSNVVVHASKERTGNDIPGCSCNEIASTELMRGAENM